MNPRLEKITKDLANGGSPPQLTTREFLSWFDAQRRGYWIVRAIRHDLKEAALQTVPDFESNYIDALLELRPTPSSETLSREAAASTETSVPSDGIGPIDPPSERSATNSNWVRKDPTYRISKLGPANQAVVSVKPDGTLAEAIAILLLRNFSQLPVMTNEREVKGVITWKSIGARLALSGPAAHARDVMEPHHEIRTQFSIFDAIPLIVTHQYVLVRGAGNRITGIITASDLSEQFRLLAEPFLLLGEIENLLRDMIADRFSLSDLSDARDPSNGERRIQSPADLAFGEYVRLLEHPDRWRQFGLAIDRVRFCKDLDNVRKIRNDVMHFDPDGVTTTALDNLRDFTNFLKNVQSILPHVPGSV